MMAFRLGVHDGKLSEGELTVLKPAYWLIIGGGLLLLVVTKLILFLRLNATLARHAERAKQTQAAAPGPDGQPPEGRA
jgi:hypothetical protein